MATSTIAQDHPEIWAALATVNDPEIKRPITDIGMVDAVSVGTDGVTGYTLINAADIDEAEKIALSHPTVPTIQVFEAMPM